jgi:hypothetical protein
MIADGIFRREIYPKILGNETDNKCNVNKFVPVTGHYL